MDASSTLGLILAGGRSRRMGMDKAFATLAGRPLLAHAIERLAPQVDRVVISSNAPAPNFADYGVPVLPDMLGGFRGPLAGIHAALATFPDAMIVSVAVDLPLLPRDLVARLKAGWNGTRCRYAAQGCASAASAGRAGAAASNGDRHALAILWPPGQAATLGDFLESGRRGVSDWLGRHGDPVTLFPGTDADLDVNINTPADLAKTEALVAQQAR